MALFRRVARLFRADFHAVLDRVEEPDILLRQAIREMEEALSRDEQTSKRYEREREQLAKKEFELERLRGTLCEELDVCFAADKDDLARPLMRRRLETERALELLRQRGEQLGTQSDQLVRQLSEKRARYESMRQKADLFDERYEVPAPAVGWPGIDIRVRDEDVEVALLRERQRRAAS